MLIEQIIEEAWAPRPYMYSYSWLILWLNKNLSGKFSSGLLFTAKILHKAVHLTSPYLANSLTKFITKMPDFKRV